MTLNPEYYMQIAFELAKKGDASPNPQVGCVIVKDDKIIGQGYHEKFGQNHAEIQALNDARKKGNENLIKNSEMFVTLEPCCHAGKTPPCTEQIIKADIKKIYVSVQDENPKIYGKGIKALQDAEIEVELGVMENYGKEFYKKFFTYIAKQRPFVTLKVAMSLDGMIASKNQKEKYITSEESRKEVHRIRAKHDAILVGVNTIISDNPELNVRLTDGKNPKIIILDSELRTPENARIFNRDKLDEISTESIIIFTSKKTDPKKLAKLENKAKIMTVDKNDNTLELKKILEEIYKVGIMSVMIEGGQKVFTSFLEEGIVDELIVFIAPVFLQDGKKWIETNKKIFDSFRIKELRKIKEDTMIVFSRE